MPEITPGPNLPASRPIGAQPEVGRRDLNLPNLITLARLLAVPVVAWLILDAQYGAAFWLFVAAGASDGLDGYIAKHFDCRTTLGALLDPAADKTLLASVYLMLGLVGQLPIWLVILVVLRDTLIVLGYAVIQGLAAPHRLGPLFVSKVNTLMQIVLVVFVLARLGLGIEAGSATRGLIVAAAVTTALSGLAYLVRWVRVMRGARAGAREAK